MPLALAVAAYARVLDAPFLLDDEGVIRANPALRNVGAAAVRIVTDLFTGAGRPVADFTFALNHAVGGLEPWNFHATNLALHLAVVALVFLLTGKLARLAGAAHDSAIATGVAGVFALHPIQTEAVSYVVQRSEVLASGLYLLVVLLLITAEQHGRGWRGTIAWSSALLAYALALGSKPIAVTAPAAYLLAAAAVEGTPLARSELTSWRRRAVLVAPFFAVAGRLSAALLRSLPRESNVGFDIPRLGPFDYFTTELKVIVLYLRLLVWPAGQNLDWEFPVSTSLLQPGVLASGALLVILAACGVALVVWGRTRGGEAAGGARLAGLGILWFFLLLSVTSSVVPVLDLVFEHRLYLASWGVFLAAAVGLDRLAARFALGTSATRALVAGLWCVLAGATWTRNAAWETPEALWRDTMSKSPGKARAFGSLGDVLYAQGRYVESVPMYARGLELVRGGDPHEEAKFLHLLGNAQARSERWQDAAVSFRAALDLEPYRAEHWSDLGSALLNLGNLSGAERSILRSLALEPTHPSTWNNLGELRLAQGDPQAALGALRRAAGLHPPLGMVPFNAGRALAAMGKLPEACIAWREALTRRLVATERQQVVDILAERCRSR